MLITSAVNAAEANSVQQPNAATSSHSTVRLTPIEDLQVGERVRADSPTSNLDLQFGTEVVSADWRKLTLLAPKRDGTMADVALLRPLFWLNEQKAEVGGTVYISVPECGIDGHAKVLSIESCPEIVPGQGRVITGTFRHHALSSILLSIAGQTEPILCTGNHPFWSEDRQNFVRADSLQPNETLRTTSGATRVTALIHAPGSTPVFNLEIHSLHVYHVGTAGVLVHNGDPTDCVFTLDQLVTNGAASRLGVDLEKIVISDGVARLRIGRTESIVKADLDALKGFLRGKGVTRVEVDTGLLSNSRLGGFLNDRLKDGRPIWGGGTVENSTLPGLSEFVIIFQL